MMRRFLVRLTVVAAVVGLTTGAADAVPPPATFAPANSYSAGLDPFSVAAADLNADGKLDLAVANEADQTVSVMLGRGDGSFEARTTYSAGTGPWTVAAADLNGDGKSDLAVADLNGNAVSVLLGNGDGTFRARTSYVVGTLPKFVTAADLNGDGKPDLAVANSGSNTVSVLLGNGDGTFQAQTNYVTGNGPVSLAAADLNGDGRLDIAVANSGSNTVSVLLGNGDGSFRTATSYGVSGSQPDSVAAVDLNGDGKPDLAVASFGGDVVSVLLGNGDGSFGPRTSYPAGHGPRWVAAVDLNSDGNADLAVADETDGTQTCCSGTVSVLLGNGDGTFQPRITYVAGVSPGPGAIADLNGDGKPDLAVTNETGAAVSVLLNTTQGLAPVVNIGAGSAVAEGNAFAGSGSFTDPDSSSWTASVDYGDGTGVQPLPLVGNSFALQHVYDDNGIYPLRVTVTDNGGASGSVSTQVTVANVAPSATFTVDSPVTEGSASTLTLAGASDPSNADTQAGFRYSFACDGDTASLATSYTTADAGSSHACAFADNGSYPVVARVLDKDGGESTYNAVVTVANVAPTVGAISAPADPVALGAAVSIGAPFIDAGVLDTHTALIDWGDGTTSSAAVAEANGSGTAAADHAYAVPGVYTITLTVTDKDGASGQAAYAYVVAYDPSGASVRGSGTILSPPGAYAADASLTGEATFGFDAAYKHGATTPDGRTRFRFKSADFTFVSTSYDWLVVAGARAQFKGAGGVNGGDGYAFMLTVTDGDVVGGGGTDKLRIKIWNVATGAVVYDNQTGAGDTADASEAISKGDITIK